MANNKKAVYGKKTTSHSTTATQLKLNEDNFRKYEYLWWEKKLVGAHTDYVAEEILEKIDKIKSRLLAEQLIKKNFKTQDQLAKWLKGVPDEWDKLMEPKFKTLAKKVNPKLIFYQDKIAKFKKTSIEKYNPYQAIKLPDIKTLKKAMLCKVWDQVGGQVWATSYWAIKITLELPINHWFFDFLKLGVMVVFVKGKVKVFGKKGKYLGEYNESDF